MLLHSVTKSYHDHLVLDGISFEFTKGQLIGLVGKNGAGKSTLMKILAQTIQDFEGTLTNAQRVGYLIEEPKLYNAKTGRAHLKYFSEIYGNSFYFSEYEELLKGLRLKEVLDKKVREYSLGMKQKLSIMLSLLNSPDYVILDEPTNGMDIETSMEVLLHLKTLAKERNIGILISSHKLEDIESICSRVLFLEDGQLHEETLHETAYSLVTLQVATRSESDVFQRSQQIGKVLRAHETTFELQTRKTTQEIFKELQNLGIQLVDFSTEKQTLRSVYMKKSGGAKHGA